MSAYSVHEYAREHGLDPAALVEACILRQEHYGYDYGIGRRTIPDGEWWLADEYHPLAEIEAAAAEIKEGRHEVLDRGADGDADSGPSDHHGD
jgi:hypothetical protein